MTTTAVPAKPALLSRSLMLCFIPIVGSSFSFFLPLSVVPLFAERSGGDAGLATVALLLATVVCELATPQLIARVGYRWALGLGLLLLGAPTLVLTAADSTAAILAVSVLRGAGFAISAVATNAVAAMLIPADRRGEGLALAGVMSGLPSLFALPLGVWVATHEGFAPVFIAAAVAPLLGLLAVPGLTHGATTPKSATKPENSMVAGLRNAALTRLAVIFAASTVAVGVVVTFLPLAVTGQPAVAALFAQPAAATLTRWIAGRLGDRYGTARLLSPGLILSATGMAALALTGIPFAVIGGAVVFGIGFGVLQNATLALMYARVPAGGEGTVSAIWNAAYDLGMAAGALGAGLVVTSTGYPMTFVLTAAVMVPALWLVRRDRRPAPRQVPAALLTCGPRQVPVSETSVADRLHMIEAR